MRPPAPPEDLDLLHAALLRAGESVPALRAALAAHAPDALLLIALLRARCPCDCWRCSPARRGRRTRALLAGVVLNPRATVPLSLRLLPSLFWRDLAAAALAPQVAGPDARARRGAAARAAPDLRLGERVALAKIATAPVLALLLADEDTLVAEACLINPRLREEDLATALRSDSASRALIEAAGASTRWSANYAVRLALVLQPRTPLALALGQLSALVPRDLRRVAEAPIAQLLCVAAQRLLDQMAASTEPET